MKKRVLFYIFGVLAFGLGSCGDFLEEYSQNQRYATTAQDLDELLRGECFMQSSNPSSNTQETMGFSSGLTMNYPWLHVMDDDAEEFVEGGFPYTSSYPRNVLGSFYHWGSDPFLTLENDQYRDNDWERFYKSIGVLNSIIYMADEFRSKEEDIELLNRVEAEARFLRAGYYFLLVHIYGMPYTDLKRATVCLEGIVPSSTLRVGEVAANALLSRVYLYMEEYEACIAAADEAMAGAYSVMDLNSWTDGKNVISWTSPETIFTQGGNAVVSTFLSSSTDWNNPNPDYTYPQQAFSYQVSEDLLRCYSDGDLRRTAFFKNSLHAAIPDKY